MDDRVATERSLRSDAKHSRRSLLEAARDLIAERGPEALTVVAVARRAGLNRSTAYQHFKTREQLIESVGAAFAEEVGAMFREPRQFGDQIDFFVHYFQKRPDIARLWMFRILTGHGKNVPGWGAYVSALERLAKSSRSQAGIDAEMLGVIGMTSALVWSLMARDEADGDAEVAQTQRFASELKRLFLFGALRPEAWPELTAEFETQN